MTFNASWLTLFALVMLVIVALVVDLTSATVRGLWPAALLVVVGWLLLWRTRQEMAESFSGPEGHRPWLQATGWFLILAGLLGMLLSLLPLSRF